MASYYYAFCKVHKKCGPNRSNINDAWDDCEKHENEVDGPHMEVYPKLSAVLMVKGVKKYRYKAFRNKQ